MVLLVESFVTGSQVHRAAGTICSHLAAEEELAAVEELGALEELPAGEELGAVEEPVDVEDLADVWELADVKGQTALLVPSQEEAWRPAGTARTAQVAGWPRA